MHVESLSSDELILSKAVEFIQSEKQPVLVTVLKTWGSSPRPCGSQMLICEDGTHTGSVSGGCIEADLVARYQRGELELSTPCILDYGVNRLEAQRFGLPCGGRLELSVEKLESEVQFNHLLEAIAKGELVRRSVCLNTGEVSLHRVGAQDFGKETYFEYTKDRINRLFGPQWSLFLVGAGHLSHFVSQIGNMLGYAVQICDPREECRASWESSYSNSANIVAGMPDDIVKQLTNVRRTAVLTLTHDPKLDDMALMEALKGDFFYVGALGSKNTNEARRKRLLELGLSASEVAKLHGPVGLAIGSHSPAEIAVSIFAELVQVRNALEK